MVSREGRCHTKEKDQQGQRRCDKEGGIQLWLQENELGSLEGDEAKQAGGL